MKYKLEFYPTNPLRPCAIWDQEKLEKEGWDEALVAKCDPRRGMAYYEELVARMNAERKSGRHG